MYSSLRLTRAFCGISPSDTVVWCPQAPWLVIAPCFQVPRIAHSQNNRAPLRRVMWWMMQLSSSPMLICHTGRVTVTPNPCTGFKAYENCSKDCRSVIHRGSLTYLVAAALASPPPSPPGSNELFPSSLHWSPLWLLTISSHPVTSFLAPDAFPPFSPRNIVSPFLPWLLSFLESHGGNFYFTPEVHVSKF
jgi:hypothetical protein